MKKVFVLISFAFCLYLPNCLAQKNWNSIFNGKNLDGWQLKCTPEDSLSNFFYVENGAIIINSTGNNTHDYVWLLTEKEYDDFELKLKFAAYKNSTGNSGIQIRSRYDDLFLWLDGPQVDINPPGPWRSGMMWDETRTVKRWIYPDLPKGEWVNEEMAISNPDFYYSDDSLQWNKLRILAEEWSIKAWLNDSLITNFNSQELLDSESHRIYKVGRKGHIALQLHVKDELKLQYKDIYIREK